VLLLHAILPAEAAEPPPAGLRGWPLREVRASGLGAWATLCDTGESFSPGREDLLAHHRLIQRALGACLPVRFPTWLADEPALAALLEQRRVELFDALARVRGRVELAVTACWTSEAAADAPLRSGAPGRRFLEERRRRYAVADQRRAEAQRLAKLLERQPEVVEARHRLCPSQAIGLSSAVLVDAEHAEAVRERLPRELGENVRILVNGPWPPYSFASLDSAPRPREV
jgi:hypothetical protein